MNIIGIRRRLDELDAILMDLVALSAKSDAGADYFDEKFKEIAGEKKALKGKLREQERHQVILDNIACYS